MYEDTDDFVIGTPHGIYLSSCHPYSYSYFKPQSSRRSGSTVIAIAVMSFKQNRIGSFIRLSPTGPVMTVVLTSLTTFLTVERSSKKWAHAMTASETSNRIVLFETGACAHLAEASCCLLHRRNKEARALLRGAGTCLLRLIITKTGCGRHTQARRLLFVYGVCFGTGARVDISICDYIIVHMSL